MDRITAPVVGADRAVAPVVGVALLVALTVFAGVAVGTTALALGAPDDPAVASLSLSVDAATDRITVGHRAGDTLTVATLRIRIAVDGQPLAHQPPVPFFAAEGYRAGPTGPFNSGGSGSWSAGQRASLRLASTNAPLPESGDSITVRLFANGARIAVLETTAE